MVKAALLRTILLLTAALHAPVGRAQDEVNAELQTLGPYLATLEKFGVPPDGAGAVNYLRGLRPHPEREQEVADLLKQLGDGSFQTREAATQQLLRMPNLPIALVSAAAEHKDPEVRWRAREVLQQSQSKSADVLFAALKAIAVFRPADAAPELLYVLPLCREPHLRDAAIDALRRAAAPEDRPLLQKALAGDSQPVRLAAIVGLTSITPKEDRARLHPQLDDRNDAVSLETARWLADLGDRTALPALVRLLDAQQQDVRSAAALTLRGLSGMNMGFISYNSAAERRDAVKRWRTWTANEGQTAELTFPVPRRRSARGDLAGNTLVSTGGKGKVIEFDPAGREVWSFPLSAWSAEKLQNGNVLIGSYNQRRVVEVDRAGKVVWELGGVSAMTAKPLLNGNFLISDFNGKRVVEMARNKQVVWEHKTDQQCFDSDRLPNGNTIYGCPNLVREVTSDHKTVREWTIKGRLNGFQALPSGNILVANYGRRSGRTPAPTGRQVWRLQESQPCDVFRLPSGNTLVSTNQRIIEVDAGGKLIKEICKSQYGSARR